MESVSQQQGEVPDARAARVLRGCSFIVTGIVPVSVVMMLIVGAPLWTPIGLVAVAVAGHLARLTLRRGGDVEVAMHRILRLTLIGVIIPILGLGGIAAPGKAWILIVPVLAGLMGGTRTARLYGALSVAALGVVAATDLLGLTPAVPMAPNYAALFDTLQTAMVTIVTLFLVGAFTSAQRQAEQDLRVANAELSQSRDVARAATAARGEFLANMSHEIRTPMNGVVGMTTLLLDTPLTSAQREYAEIARNSADALLTVVNDILDFSKIEAGKLNVELIDTDVRNCAEDVASIVAFQAAGKGIELIVDIDPRLPRRALTDPVRLRQCLTNLLSNAIKFTARGEVVLEVATVETSGSFDTTFTVRDTGIGIAEERLKKLFVPFEQADGSTTRRFGGTGLGLSIAKRLVELMGGTIGARSVEGQGSEFWFTLPLTAVADDTAARQTVRARSARILVVDDNAANLAVLASHLTQANHQVTSCSSGVAALDVMRAAAKSGGPFEVLVTDHQMAGVSAAELAAAVRDEPRLASARVVVLASIDRGHELETATQGVAAWLHKPVRMSQLLECIDRVLQYSPEEWHLHTQPVVTRARLEASQPTQRYSGPVLVVEDNPVNQKVARRFLEKLGLHVTVAPDGAAGVAAFEQGAFALVLMDVQMPILDGYEATRRIRALELARGTHTPIIALTADAMPQHLDECRNAGMDDCLTKPIDSERLRAVLERFMRTAEEAPSDRSVVRSA